MIFFDHIDVPTASVAGPHLVCVRISHQETSVHWNKSPLARCARARAWDAGASHRRVVAVVAVLARLKIHASPPDLTTARQQWAHRPDRFLRRSPLGSISS